MKKILVLLPLFTTILSADLTKPLAIDSDYVNYDGKQMTLIGHATVDHELGTVQAQHVTIIPEKEGKKMRFAHLLLKGEVKITLNEGGELCCSQAELDYHALTGKFLSQNEPVTYTEMLKGKETNDAKPLEIKSQQMHVQLQRQGIKEASQLVISQMTTDQNVCINYNENLTATALQGRYERWNPSADETSITPNKIKGILCLEGDCHVHDKNGDQIYADKITIDLLKHELHLDLPKGHLKTRETDNQNELEFSCVRMTWEEQPDLLTLRDDVHVTLKGVGTLTNPHEVRIYREMMEGRKQLRLMDCIGPSTIAYQDALKGDNYILTTYKRLSLDRRIMQAHLESPIDASKKVIENQQVYFAGPLGDIYADDVIVYYKEIDKQLVPLKVLLKGDVWMLKRTSADVEDPGKIVQFALSDRVEYDMTSKEMLFLANYGKRVLFFDKGNNLQVSAPSVKVKRDSDTQKDVVQGIGDVRFSFIEKEFDLLQKRFGASEINTGGL